MSANTTKAKDKQRGVEIERKFLVKNDAWQKLGTPVYYCQGYLNDAKERTVRVRIAGDKAFLTIKGANVGAVRSEFEYEIPVAEARHMLENLALRPLIEKTRTVIQDHDHVWEVDAFMGENAGLVVAEIELADEFEAFERPEWLGEEVTGDARYYNSSLVRHPYCQWKDVAAN